MANFMLSGVRPRVSMRSGALKFDSEDIGWMRDRLRVVLQTEAIPRGRGYVAPSGKIVFARDAHGCTVTYESTYLPRKGEAPSAN